MAQDHLWLGQGLLGFAARASLSEDNPEAWFAEGLHRNRHPHRTYGETFRVALPCVRPC